MIRSYTQITPRLVLGVVLFVLTQTAYAGNIHSIKIEGMKFIPDSLAVKAGDEIVWKNEDIVPHTATASSKSKSGKPVFDSGNIAPGASYKLKLKEGGAIKYQCLYHPTMNGQLSVSK